MIWALVSRRLRLWLMFGVGVPLLARVFRSIGETLEQRSGESSVTRGLRTGSQTLSKFERRTRRQDRRARRTAQHS